MCSGPGNTNLFNIIQFSLKFSSTNWQKKKTVHIFMEARLNKIFIEEREAVS